MACGCSFCGGTSGQLALRCICRAFSHGQLPSEIKIRFHLENLWDRNRQLCCWGKQGRLLSSAREGQDLQPVGWPEAQCLPESCCHLPCSESCSSSTHGKEQSEKWVPGAICLHHGACVLAPGFTLKPMRREVSVVCSLWWLYRSCSVDHRWQTEKFNRNTRAWLSRFKIKHFSGRYSVLSKADVHIISSYCATAYCRM